MLRRGNVGGGRHLLMERLSRTSSARLLLAGDLEACRSEALDSTVEVSRGATWRKRALESSLGDIF